MRRYWMRALWLFLGVTAVCSWGQESELAKLQAAVKASPDDAAAHVALGDYYVRAYRFDQALTEYQKAEKLDPKEPGAYLGQAEVMLRSQDDPRAALKIVERGLSAVPGNPGLLEKRGVAYLGLKQYDEAGRALAEAAARDPAIAAKRWDEALELWRRYLSHKKNADASYGVEEVSQYLRWADEAADLAAPLEGPTWTATDLADAIGLWTQWYMIEHDRWLYSESARHYCLAVQAPGDAQDQDLEAARQRIAVEEFGPQAVLTRDGRLLWVQSCDEIEQPYVYQEVAQQLDFREATAGRRITLLSVIEPNETLPRRQIKLAFAGKVTAQGLKLTGFGVAGAPATFDLLQRGLGEYRKLAPRGQGVKALECANEAEARHLFELFNEVAGYARNAEQDGKLFRSEDGIGEAAAVLTYIRVAEGRKLFVPTREEQQRAQADREFHEQAARQLPLMMLQQRAKKWLHWGLIIGVPVIVVLIVVGLILAIRLTRPRPASPPDT